MKKFALLICAIMLLMSVNPVVAQGGRPEPTGDRIDLWAGDQTYPANTAFYIGDSFYYDTGYQAYPGKFDIQLEVDSNFVNEDGVYHGAIVGEDVTYVVVGWLYNFPDGMQGTHTFEIHFMYACELALQEGLTDYCSYPTAPFEVLNLEAEVTFITP
jgi:hypothetical protein